MKRTSGEHATWLEKPPLAEDDGPKELELCMEEKGLRPVGPDVWCRACGAIHEERRCGGEVRASGPERHAWRAVFETPHGGREVHGVLVAPAEGRWRARILTYPRMLWTFPGTAVTLKFVTGHPLEAERRAIDYIKAHCARIGQRLRPHEEALAVVGAFDPESKDGDPTRESRRRLRTLPIRFGTEAPRLEARTVDLSERGLFIATEARLARGARIRMLLEVGPCRMPLQGVVAWTRAVAEPGRPCGLGVEIFHPPALFLDYVRRLP